MDRRELIKLGAGAVVSGITLTGAAAAPAGARDEQVEQWGVFETEAYNDFLDWVCFGGPVVKSGDPVEQEKQLKYASLVANAVMRASSKIIETRGI
jgi:hypothetical protein